MAIRWQREWPHWLILWAMLALAAFTWDVAPDRIPIHWGPSGEPDRFGGKVEGLLFLPMIALVTYVGLLLVPRFMRTTEEQLGNVYAWLRLAILVMLAALYAAIVLTIWGVPLDVGRIGPTLVGALLFTIGSVMGRMRPNAIMGVRTPWTLTSRRSWDASHRVGGWVFMAVGALLAVGGLTGMVWLLLGSIVGLLGGIVGLVLYGWWVCRSDPRRLPKGQTLLTAGEERSIAGADEQAGAAEQRRGGAGKAGSAPGRKRRRSRR